MRGVHTRSKKNVCGEVHTQHTSHVYVCVATCAQVSIICICAWICTCVHMYTLNTGSVSLLLSRCLNLPPKENSILKKQLRCGSREHAGFSTFSAPLHSTLPMSLVILVLFKNPWVSSGCSDPPLALRTTQKAASGIRPSPPPPCAFTASVFLSFPFLVQLFSSLPVDTERSPSSPCQDLFCLSECFLLPLLVEAQPGVAPVLRRLREKHPERFPFETGWPLQPLPTAVSNPRSGATCPAARWLGAAPACCPEDGAVGRGGSAELADRVPFLGPQQSR